MINFRVIVLHEFELCISVIEYPGFSVNATLSLFIDAIIFKYPFYNISLRLLKIKGIMLAIKIRDFIDDFIII